MELSADVSRTGPEKHSPQREAVCRDITFVLPGDGRSGGVRVTAIMANLLRERGHRVRIAHRIAPFSWRSVFAGLKSRLPQRRETAGFLHEFRGAKRSFRRLDDLAYAPGEVVIAVGTYTVAEVRRMTKPVLKLRFNHGFPARPRPEDEEAWRGPMPTITVSNTLVPRLQELTGGNVLGVVPNGIATDDYFVDPGVVRDGVGALYNRHANKAPEDLIAVLQEIHRRRPSVPQFVFGTEPRPKGLEHVEYKQLPSVAEARTLYNRCKSWVLTSRTEGLPGVVLEAMACGCVVVSSDNDGSKEIIDHGSSGLLAPCGDRDAIVVQLERSLDDEALRQRVLSGAAERVRQFTWERAADRMEAMLTRLCESKEGESVPCGRTSAGVSNPLHLA